MHGARTGCTVHAHTRRGARPPTVQRETLKGIHETNAQHPRVVRTRAYSSERVRVQSAVQAGRDQASCACWAAGAISNAPGAKSASRSAEALAAANIVTSSKASAAAAVA
eukprot:1017585-Pleurochrysis_carterae.AAC.1